MIYFSMALTTTTIKFGNQSNLQISQFSAASKIPTYPSDARAMLESVSPRAMSSFVLWEESLVVNFSKNV